MIVKDMGEHSNYYESIILSFRDYVSAIRKKYSDEILAKVRYVLVANPKRILMALLHSTSSFKGGILLSSSTLIVSF